MYPFPSALQIFLTFTSAQIDFHWQCVIKKWIPISNNALTLSYLPTPVTLSLYFFFSDSQLCCFTTSLPGLIIIMPGVCWGFATANWISEPDSVEVSSGGCLRLWRRHRHEMTAIPPQWPLWPTDQLRLWCCVDGCHCALCFCIRDPNRLSWWQFLQIALCLFLKLFASFRLFSLSVYQRRSGRARCRVSGSVDSVLWRLRPMCGWAGL